MVRYYGYYSNVSPRKRQKEGSDETITCILEPSRNEKIFRRNRARLIQKIYEVDPLICSNYKVAKMIVSGIEEPLVISRITFFPSVIINSYNYLTLHSCRCSQGFRLLEDFEKPVIGFSV